MKKDTTRRGFLRLTGAGAIASVLPAVAACATRPAAPAGAPPGPPPGGPLMPPASEPCVAAVDAGATAADAALAVREPIEPKKVRIVSVPTAVEGNLLATLVADFQKSTGLEVTIESTEGPFQVARDGKADLVVSHYGHRNLEEFVLDGLGEWPRTIFSNQMALVGPPSDPAKVRGLGDIVEAFKRIAAKKSPFLLNGSDGGHYLVDVIWNAAGRPNKTGWFFDDGLKKEASVKLVEARHAYSIWGLTPFMRTEKEGHLDLEPLVLADPLLQRVLVCTIVKDTKVPGVNAAAAKALQTYLLSAVTQAKIHETRHEGTHAMWTPAGRHNRSNFLPKD